MDQLTSAQRQIVERVASELACAPGLTALVIGGSHARGRARPDSDIDIGLFYADTRPLDVGAVAAAAGRLNDAPDPTVSDLYGWGRWVNGGAWLTIEGQRVDLLFRSQNDIERTLEEAKAGRFEIDIDQQPPFGFFGPTILGEVAIAQTIWDPGDVVSRLKARVSPMPIALVRAVTQSRLWQVEFGLKAFAPKFAANANAYGVAGCLSRFAFGLVLTLFALNRVYLLNDKTALSEIEDFALAPHSFGIRINEILSAVGDNAHSQGQALSALASLFEEVRALAGDLYTAPWRV